MMESNWSQDVYLKAWDFATIAHQGQTYAGPIAGQRIDYINHIGSANHLLAKRLEQRIDAYKKYI